MSEDKPVRSRRPNIHTKTWEYVYNSGAPAFEEDIELTSQSTQTEKYCGERGVQILSGRHANRPRHLLVQESVQTEHQQGAAVSPSGKRILSYMKYVLVSVASVFTAFTIGFVIMPYVRRAFIYEEPPVRQDSTIERFKNFMADFVHKCRHCPRHR